jgi:hypothetical protein
VSGDIASVKQKRPVLRTAHGGEILLKSFENQCRVVKMANKK